MMIPEYRLTQWWQVETYDGCVVADATIFSLSEMCDSSIVGAAIIDPPEKVSGWCWRLSMPGYLDCTERAGPFDTLREARQDCSDTFDCDPDTGEECQ